MAFDDSDVKIFNDCEEKTDSFDEVSIIAEMTKHRSNGNIEKAKKLGKDLADIFVNESRLISDLENEVGKINRDDDTIYQIKVLLVFAAEYCLNHYLSTPLLSSTAVNSLYSRISKKQAEFYDRLDDAAEYSFYYLAVRKEIHISTNIGMSFAMLCGKEKDTYYENLGKRIFQIARHEIKKIILKANFAE